MATSSSGEEFAEGTLLWVLRTAIATLGLLIVGMFAVGLYSAAALFVIWQVFPEALPYAWISIVALSFGFIGSLKDEGIPRVEVEDEDSVTISGFVVSILLLGSSTVGLMVGAPAVIAAVIASTGVEGAVVVALFIGLFGPLLDVVAARKLRISFGLFGLIVASNLLDAIWWLAGWTPTSTDTAESNFRTMIRPPGHG